jgi:transposase-like protein
MAEHPGYEKHDNAGDNSGDSRNGHSEKTVCLENRQAVIQVPRDRNGTFEPTILPKHQKRVPLFNGRIIPMYSFGITNRNIKSRLEQVYNGEVPPELASRVTDAVMEDAGDWQSRPLEKSYAIVYLDALWVNNSRQDGKSCQKSVYAARGKRGGEVPGVSAERNTQPGAEDILIVRMDELSGFPDAVRAVFPQTRIQRRIVHMVRNSARFVSYKDLKEVCAGLKTIYRAPGEEAVRAALEEFGKNWGAKYPLVYQSWDAAWPDLCGFFKHPEEIPPGDLHDERDRIAELPVEESDAQPFGADER